MSIADPAHHGFMTEHRLGGLQKEKEKASHPQNCSEMWALGGSPQQMLAPERRRTSDQLGEGRESNSSCPMLAEHSQFNCILTVNCIQDDFVALVKWIMCG